MAEAKHKFQRLIFNPANQKITHFLDEIWTLAKDAIGVAAHAIIEQFIYAKTPPHLKKSFNQAHWLNGTCEQIVSNLKKALQFNGLEALDELQINTVTQQATQQNPKKTHTNLPLLQRNHVTTKTSAVNSNERSTRPKTIWVVPVLPAVTITVVRQDLTPTIRFPKLPTQIIQITEMTQNLDLSTYPVRPEVKLTIPQRNATLEQTQLIDRLPRTDGRKDRINVNVQPAA